MYDLAPIILFVYNRPDHARRTLAALSANPLAIESDLIVTNDLHGQRRIDLPEPLYEVVSE